MYTFQYLDVVHLVQEIANNARILNGGRGTWVKGD